MAQRTISATGGNWNSFTTWVEGAVPTSSDFVVGNASSGQLTINVTAACQYLNLSAYTQTITFNANITAALAAGTTTFGSGMNFNAGTGGLMIFSTTHIIAQNTTNRIPNMQFSVGTKTLTTNLYCVNLFVPNLGFQVNGNNIYISGNLLQLNATFSSGIFGSTNWILDGSGLISFIYGPGSTTRTIEITGNYETTGAGLSLLDANTFIYTAGTAGSTFNILLGTQTNSSNGSNNIRISNNPTIKIFLYEAAAGVGVNQTLNLLAPLNVDYIGIFPTTRTYTTDANLQSYLFSGNSVSANTLSIGPTFRTTSTTTYPTTSASTTYKSIDLQFDRNYTHYIGSMKLNGGGIPTKPVIKSNSAGNQVSINLGSKITSQIIDYDFTDVNASGGQQIVAINGTLSNTTNVTNVYPTGSGGGETSSVFIS
jgi:hypothetical protein